MTLTTLFCVSAVRTGRVGVSGGIFHEPQWIVPPGVSLLVLESNFGFPWFLSL